MGNGGEVREEERREVMERGKRRERGNVRMAVLWLPLYIGLQNNSEV